MPIKKDYIFNFIFAALIFLALGLFTSPTIVSLYHILLIVPTILLFKAGERFKIATSGRILILLFLWGLLSTFVNYPDLIKPFKAFQELKYYLLGVICILPLRYFLENAKDKHLRILFNIFFVTLITGFFVGIIKAYGGFDIVHWKQGAFKNRSGGFLNYMRYGYGSAFVFLLGIGLLLNQQLFKKILHPYLFKSALTLSALAIFAAKTRGAILAVLIGLPILFLKYKKKLALIVILAGALFVSVVLYISIFSNSSHRLLNINDNSNKVRMSQFYSAIKATQEKPILGFGANQFSYQVTRLKKKYNIWSDHYVGHSHNIFLEHAASYGVVGLVIFIAFLLAWLKELYQSKGRESWIFLSYLLAFIVSGQVELLFDNLNSHLFFFIYSMSQVMLMSQQVRKRLFSSVSES